MVFLDIMKHIVLFIGCLVTAGARAQAVHWPHHKKAAIVLTYDDALNSQLDTAVPQLKRAGFKATFFLTGDMDYATIPRWKKLAGEGFELGNHTLYHPCESARDNPVSSDNYSKFQLIMEISVMNHLLYAMDGKTVRTYAYPCAETTVGGKDYVDSLRTSREVEFARIGGDQEDAVITDFNRLDSLRVPSLGLEDHTDAATIISFIRKVQAAGGLGIIMFHGIGGDYITTATDVHQAVLDYLNKNRKEIWVATFRQAMEYAMSHR